MIPLRCTEGEGARRIGTLSLPGAPTYERQAVVVVKGAGGPWMCLTVEESLSLTGDPIELPIPRRRVPRLVAILRCAPARQIWTGRAPFGGGSVVEVGALAMLEGEPGSKVAWRGHSIMAGGGGSDHVNAWVRLTKRSGARLAQWIEEAAE
jgi:hypothetical protein